MYRLLQLQCRAGKGFGTSSLGPKGSGSKSGGLAKTPQQVRSSRLGVTPLCLSALHATVSLTLRNTPWSTLLQAADRALAEAGQRRPKVRPVNPKEAARGKVDYVQVCVWWQQQQQQQQQRPGLWH
jgi:hypothetical protein